MSQVVLTGAPQGASSNTHECPSGCPFGPTGAPVHGCRSRYPRAPLGGPCDARWQAGGGAGMGGNPTPGQRAAKGEKPPLKGAEAAAGRTAPLTQTKNPAAVPPRRRLPRPPFRGVPAPPGGPGLPPLAVIFYSFAGFSLSLCRSRYTPRVHQGREPGPGPPAVPLPRPLAPHEPPGLRSPPWCFMIFDYTIVRSHYP